VVVGGGSKPPPYIGGGSAHTKENPRTSKEAAEMAPLAGELAKIFDF